MSSSGPRGRIDEKCVIAGFGGQGVMLMGQILAQAALLEDRYVSWLPSYGPEMRGGTANCMVVISEEEIPSPIIDHDATAVIVLNLPSLDKFTPHLMPGGRLFVNRSLIDAPSPRDDVQVIDVPCNDIALRLGNAKMTNMVMLGAFVEATGCLREDSVLAALRMKLGERKAHLIDANRAAFEEGARCAREQVPGTLAVPGAR